MLEQNSVRMKARDTQALEVKRAKKQEQLDALL